MKYAIAFLVGLVVGAAMFASALFYNPFMSQPSVSPLAVTEERIIKLSYSAVPKDAILYTDNGESIVAPHPDRVAELWEPAVADTRIFVTMLQDSRGGHAGLGIKFLSASEQTAVIKGQALANSVWHIYLPGQGTLLIDQTENFWSYLRDVVVPARWSSGDNWRGTYHGIMTSGPGSLGTARVTGGSGLLSGMITESIESLTARGYSAVTGPVSMQGSLTIAIPEVSTAQK
jgi:hypothetical protein